MEKDKKYNVILGIMIFLFILLVGVAVAFGLGVIGLKENKNVTTTNNETSKIENDNIVVNKDNTKGKIINTEESDTKLNFDKANTVSIVGKKCLNPMNEETTYEVNSGLSSTQGVDAYKNNDKIYFEVTPDGFWEYCNLKINEKTKYEVSGIDPLKVHDIFVGSWGNGVYYPIVIFLMNDGTLKWLNCENALKNNNFNVTGEINNVTDVIKISSATRYMKIPDDVDNDAASLTIIGIRDDGNFYDLIPLISEFIKLH